MAEFIAVALVLALLGWVFMRSAKKHAGRMQGLLQRGAVATAQVSEIECKRRSRVHDDYYVNYTFSAHNGKHYSNRILVQPKDIEVYAEGQQIDVVYDTDNPTISMFKETVDETRRVMEETR